MSDIWLNGQVVPRDEARIDIEDRGFQFADGVYEVIRLYDGRPFTLREHLDSGEENGRNAGRSSAFGIDCRWSTCAVGAAADCNWSQSEPTYRCGETSMAGSLHWEAAKEITSCLGGPR